MAPRKTENPGLAMALSFPENKSCADCGAKGTTWASVNLGVFICMECSGIHRKLGTDISVVKSVTLDTWRSEWVDLCSKVGNQIGNAYYEHRLPSNFPRPGEPGGATDGIEKWIRCKYESKDYAPSFKHGEKCPTPAELVQQGRDPDVYTRDGDKVRSASPPKEVSSREPQTSLETRPLLAQLSEYYARLGQSKTQEQLDQIVEKFTGREAALWAMLEKKYGIPVCAMPIINGPTGGSDWAKFDDQGSNLIRQSELAPSEEGCFIPDVWQGPSSDCHGVLLAAQQQEVQKDQQIDMLKHNLSSLYQIPSGQMLAPNGANYAALAQMGTPMPAQHMAHMHQVAAMQHMVAMQQMSAMQHGYAL